MSRYPRVAVVIVTHNRNKDCKETIESLLRGSELPDEIIVVDDASSKPFKFEHELVRVLRYDNEIGLSASRNAGVRASRANVIAFIDDDALATKDWIKIIRRAFRKDIDVAGGPVLPLYLVTPPKWWEEKTWGSYIGVSKDRIIGCNFAVRKSLFSDIGYFNTRLGRKKGKLLSNEEIEFIEDRASKAGAKILFISNMKVYHKIYPHRLTMWYLMKRSWWQGRSDFMRHPGSYRRIPKIVVRIMVKLLKCVLYPTQFRKWILTIIYDLGYLFS